ncbi:MAG: hypothetical protein IKO49_03995 [Bacilli bacterium]|nr:hypothetical protein [Bacilli bacterium]
MEKKQKNLIKNYIILILIFLTVILLVWYICKWYTVYTEFEKGTPVIRGTLNYEISANDFDPFIMENPSSVIYMCTSKDEKCRSFEKEFKKFVIRKDLQNDIIYLNLSDTDIDSFVENFNARYEYKVKLTSDYPLLVEFTDGKVTGLIEGEKDEPLTMTKVKQFIEINKIGKTE